MNSDNRDSPPWKFVERFKTILQILAALVVVIPALLAAWNLLQQGLTAVVPVWLILITVVFGMLGMLLGYLLGRTSFLQTRRGGALIEKIDFEYPDTPLRHGWQLGETDETQIVLNHISDGFLGNAVEIRPTGPYLLDYAVAPATRLGTSIEFAAKFEGEAYVYALVQVQSKDASKTRGLWLCFTVGTQVPKRIDNGSESWYEWMVWLKPMRLEGNWLLFRIDLEDAVARSAGQEGWRFSQLLRFRLRGNQSLAYISVYE